LKACPLWAEIEDCSSFSLRRTGQEFVQNNSRKLAQLAVKKFKLRIIVSPPQADVRPTRLTKKGITEFHGVYFFFNFHCVTL
jgi:hypothetical protein